MQNWASIFRSKQLRQQVQRRLIMTRLSWSLLIDLHKPLEWNDAVTLHQKVKFLKVSTHF